MRYDVVTIFPAAVEGLVRVGVVGRAADRGVLDIRVHDLRDHADPPHRKVDDEMYGSGAGMVFRPEPLCRAAESLRVEGLRSAVFDMQTYMQLARIEAVSRNRDVRFVVDGANHRIGVLDSAGTTSTGDDIVLYSTDLPDTVSFARPDSGFAITLTHVSGKTFHTVFGPDGIVDSGTGLVALLGGNQYERVQVFGAGGIRIQKWNGTEWITGS